MKFKNLTIATALASALTTGCSDLNSKDNEGGRSVSIPTYSKGVTAESQSEFLAKADQVTQLASKSSAVNLAVMQMAVRDIQANSTQETRDFSDLISSSMDYATRLQEASTGCDDFVQTHRNNAVTTVNGRVGSKLGVERVTCQLEGAWSSRSTQARPSKWETFSHIAGGLNYQITGDTKQALLSGDLSHLMVSFDDSNTARQPVRKFEDASRQESYSFLSLDLRAADGAQNTVQTSKRVTSSSRVISDKGAATQNTKIDYVVVYTSDYGNLVYRRTDYNLDGKTTTRSTLNDVVLVDTTTKK